MKHNNVIDMTNYFQNLQKQESAKAKSIAKCRIWQHVCDAVETLSGVVIALCVCVCTLTLFAIL
ncbi:MAG: hypothetical protein J6K84_02995 [Oscillospiraceae bacterium]|nr:hypothetical protein [Oscillospiraceae bacterium]